MASFALGWCGVACADEPAVFAADAFAQPMSAAVASEPVASGQVDEAQAASDAVSAAVLRWKSKHLARTTAIAESPESAAPVSAARGWNRTRIDTQVRPAQAISTSDPFSDPFGDRAAGSAPGEILLEPTEVESGRPTAAKTGGVEELPAPRTLRSTNSPSATPIENNFVRQPTLQAPQSSATQPPSEGVLPARPSVPCDRVYNDRNCCDVEAACKAFRQTLASSTIRHITLDITPRYMPNLSPQEDEATRTDKLRAPPRTWKNRRGEVVGTGRMTNLTNGRVIISDDSGQEIARLPVHDLSDDELCFINAYWQLPAECTLGGRQVVSRDWLAQTYHWHASALCHKPLYFEEVQLERYGHTTGPYTQPWVSGAHFFLNIAALPYHMAYQPVHECQYALGYYRPGSCAPWMIPPVPLSLRGAAAEAVAVVGGVYLIP